MSRSANLRDHIDKLLKMTTEGDTMAASELVPLVYGELKKLALSYLSSERADHTLQPTALVHEAYLRLVGTEQPFRGKAHFLATAAISMRRVLVDYARRRKAAKRGQPVGRITLSDDLLSTVRDLQILELDDLIDRLKVLDERKSRVVEMRFFGGMSLEEIADALQVARSTVAEDWAVARAWLSTEISER